MLCGWAPGQRVSGTWSLAQAVAWNPLPPTTAHASSVLIKAIPFSIPVFFFSQMHEQTPSTVLYC